MNEIFFAHSCWSAVSNWWRDERWEWGEVRLVESGDIQWCEEDPGTRGLRPHPPTPNKTIRQRHSECKIMYRMFLIICSLFLDKTKSLKGSLTEFWYTWLALHIIKMTDIYYCLKTIPSILYLSNWWNSPTLHSPYIFQSSEISLWQRNTYTFEGVKWMWLPIFYYI